MEQIRTDTKISVGRQVRNTTREEERSNLRVIAYCHVSMASDDQATSYKTQV